MQPSEFSRDDKNQAGFIAPVGKGPVKGGKPDGVPYNFGKGVVAQRAKEKFMKDSDFNPSVVNNESLVDTAIGVGKSGTTKPRVGFEQEYMKSNPKQDPLQRDIHEWSNMSEKRAKSQPTQGQ